MRNTNIWSFPVFRDFLLINRCITPKWQFSHTQLKADFSYLFLCLKKLKWFLLQFFWGPAVYSIDWLDYSITFVYCWFNFLKYFSEIQNLEEFQNFLFRSYWWPLVFIRWKMWFYFVSVLINNWIKIFWVLQT